MINSSSYQRPPQDAAECPMEHDGWRYMPEPYFDPDTHTQIIHEAVGPDGERVVLNHSSYREMDADTFRSLIERLV